MNAVPYFLWHVIAKWEEHGYKWKKDFIILAPDGKSAEMNAHNRIKPSLTKSEIPSEDDKVHYKVRLIREFAPVNYDASEPTHCFYSNDPYRLWKTTDKKDPDDHTRKEYWSTLLGLYMGEIIGMSKYANIEEKDLRKRIPPNEHLVNYIDKWVEELIENPWSSTLEAQRFLIHKFNELTGRDKDAELPRLIRVKRPAETLAPVPRMDYQEPITEPVPPVVPEPEEPQEQPAKQVIPEPDFDPFNENEIFPNMFPQKTEPVPEPDDGYEDPDDDINPEDDLRDFREINDDPEDEFNEPLRPMDEEPPVPDKQEPEEQTPDDAPDDSPDDDEDELSAFDSDWDDD